MVRDAVLVISRKGAVPRSNGFTVLEEDPSPRRPGLPRDLSGLDAAVPQNLRLPRHSAEQQLHSSDLCERGRALRHNSDHDSLRVGTLSSPGRASRTRPRRPPRSPEVPPEPPLQVAPGAQGGAEGDPARRSRAGQQPQALADGAFDFPTDRPHPGARRPAPSGRRATDRVLVGALGAPGPACSGPSPAPGARCAAPARRVDFRGRPLGLQLRARTSTDASRAAAPAPCGRQLAP